MSVYYGCDTTYNSESIGGLAGGVYDGAPNFAGSPYSLGTADYTGSGDGVEDETELTAALAAATSGEVIWIKAGATITITTAYGKQAAAGVIVASNRGVAGAAGGKIKWTYLATGYMTPLLYANSDVIFHGVQLEGPIQWAGTGDPTYDVRPGYTNLGIRGVSGAKRINIINCNIYNFNMMDIYFNGGDMPYNDETDWHVIEHCYIHGAQRHGYGYGIAAEGCASFLAKGNIFKDNRHHLMAQAYYRSSTYQNNYSAEYNNVYDAWYGYLGSDTDYAQQHQFDVHGSGEDLGETYAAGGLIAILHNTFTKNDTYSAKVNVGIRGKPKYSCIVQGNYTKKTSRSSPPAYDETVVNAAFTLLAVGGTALPSGTSLSANNMTVYDNWYGATAPTDTDPAITTVAATGIGQTSAVLNGNLTDLGDYTEVIVNFQWGLTTAYGSSTTQVVKSSTGAFSAIISGLDPSTTYHFRARCTYGASLVVYGADDDFATLAAGTPPTLTTEAATLVDDDSATLNGDLTDLGTAGTVYVYFQYGTDAGYGLETAHVAKTGTAAFDAAITGLQESTTYHFRAVAAGDGLSYGADAEFTTDAGVPEVPTCLTLAATAVEGASSTLNASMTGLDADCKATRRGFQWGTATGVYTEEWSEEGEWSADTTFSHVITGLLENTTYYASAFMDLGG